MDKLSDEIGKTNAVLEAINRCNVSGELFNLTPPRPKSMEDAEYLVWLYEHVCINIGHSIGGELHCADYGSLRRELTKFVAASLKEHRSREGGEKDNQREKDIQLICEKILSQAASDTGDSGSGGMCPFCYIDCSYNCNDLSKIEHRVNCIVLIAKDLITGHIPLPPPPEKEMK